MCTRANVGTKGTDGTDGTGNVRCLPAPVATLGEHAPDHYQHAMRYYGLLAPRSKRRTLPALFAFAKAGKTLPPSTVEVGEFAGEELRS